MRFLFSWVQSFFFYGKRRLGQIRTDVKSQITMVHPVRKIHGKSRPRVPIRLVAVHQHVRTDHSAKWLEAHREGAFNSTVRQLINGDEGDDPELGMIGMIGMIGMLLLLHDDDDDDDDLLTAPSRNGSLDSRRAHRPIAQLCWAPSAGEFWLGGAGYAQKIIPKWPNISGQLGLGPLRKMGGLISGYIVNYYNLPTHIYIYTYICI